MVIEVVTVAITTPAPRGVVARASTLSSRRSILVPSGIEVTFALAHSGPANGSPDPEADKPRDRQPSRSLADFPSALDHERHAGELACAFVQTLCAVLGRVDLE